MKLTLPQQDVYFEQLLFPDEPIYNIGAKIAIEGPVNVDLLDQAYQVLISQHDAYRGIVKAYLDSVHFNIHEEGIPPLEFLDVSTLPGADDAANTRMREMFKTPFDLTDDKPLYRFVLVRVRPDFHYLFSVYHHIITDGWSTSLMFQRLVSNYNELIEEGAVSSEYPYTYQAYAEDDAQYLYSDSYQRNKDYWLERFSTLPDQLLQKAEPNRQINRSARKELVIKREVYDKLAEVAKAHKSNTFHVILALVYIYFGRKHQNNDFAVGLPVLNRSNHSFKKTVGLFMGVSALRISLDFDMTLEELLSQIKKQLLKDYRHQRFPIGKLIQELGSGSNRLFDITLSYEKQDYAHHFTHTKTRVIPLTHESERVGLALYIREFDASEDVKIDFDYNTNYFDEEAISQVVTHFRQLLDQVCACGSKKLSDYDYITAEETHQLIHTFNATSYDFGINETFLSEIEKNASLSPHKLAVRDETNTYTYEGLLTLSTQVAKYIAGKLEVKGAPIAVLMPRSAQLIPILLGILRSGNAFIPLDPGFPRERIDYILDHSQASCVITTEDHSERGSEYTFISPGQLLTGDTSTYGNIAFSPSVNDIAYIIYTSGSTGNPKGVEVGHRSLLNFLLSMQKRPGIVAEDYLFSVTTQSFDISLLEFFTPLIAGGAVYVADSNLLSDPVAVAEKIQSIGATTMQATPSFYQMLFNSGWNGGKHLKILCGGDLLSEPLVRLLLENCGEVWNMYGPTETTIWSSVKHITSSGHHSNIGKPIHNTTFYILDGNMQLLPAGVDGHIYIGGEGLARGYFRNPGLTTERFLPNPFREDSLVYHTGDAGQWSATGELIFKGRTDNQVKIRGYRIELGEVEARLSQIEHITTAVVVARKQQQQEAILVAFVLSDQEEIDTDSIKCNLSKTLPGYMIPAHIVRLEAYPLTPNQKVDRKALAKYEVISERQKSQKNKPVSTLEIKLCRYYSDILETEDNIGTEANFFSLGGHSLNALRLAGVIERNLGYKLPLKALFDHPTVSSLAAFLDSGKAGHSVKITPVEDRSHYSITPSQYAIWLASLKSERSVAYNMFMAYEITGDIDIRLLEKAFQKIIEKFEILRTSFKEVEGAPHQVILPANQVKFSMDAIQVDEARLDEALKDYSNQAFDLSKDLLLKVGCFTTPSGRQIMLFVTHHIIMDAWSLEVLNRAMVNYYRNLTEKQVCNNEKLAFQFRDYTEYLLKYAKAEKTSALAFWQEYLKGYTWTPLIAFDKIDGTTGHTNATYSLDLGDKLLSSLNQYAIKHNYTLHTLLAAAFNILIHKTSGMEDICFGTINSGRTVSGLHSHIGMFAKTLPLRTKVRAAQSIHKVLQSVQDDLLTIDRYQDIPQEVLNILRIDAILVLQNPAFDHNDILISDGLRLTSYEVGVLFSRIPVLIEFTITQKRLRCTLNYDTTKYDHSTIDVLMIRFQTILDQLVNSNVEFVTNIDTSLTVSQDDSIEIDFGF
ncbi:amino acid adenylation domain-containing protein [Roseivirga sp. BDSF3-8]|uniref:non-ribosomal peptide synthetase n=1 Tax=Roseivirga sp. BDSF3-8 TaxID=3241598 RepID=UPI0035319563